jgi:hypothetical protein
LPAFPGGERIFEDSMHVQRSGSPACDAKRKWKSVEHQAPHNGDDISITEPERFRTYADVDRLRSGTTASMIELTISSIR